MRRVAFLLAVVLAGAVSTASGQADARMEVAIDAASRDPRPRIRNLMNEERWREAIDDAFRISLNWRVDLYRTRAFWVPARESRFEVTIVVWREPLLGQYYMTYLIPGRPPVERVYTSFNEFAFQLEQPLPIQGMRPVPEGVYYYAAALEVTALDDQQFAEMQRFIGENGRAGGGDAISNWLLRLVGVPSQTFTERSARFRVP